MVGLLLALMWADYHLRWLQPLRYYVGYALAPSQQLATLPYSLGMWWDSTAINQKQLVKENQQLHARNLVLEYRSQRLATLESENNELRDLLNASKRIEDRVLATSVIGVSPDPYNLQLTINKGGQDGVFLGQPVLDAFGLMGQVVDVMPYSASVLLISDANHAIPVQNNRNGVRAIAEGTGSLEQLELIYVPKTADIIAGDLLVSSGLGSRYPKGYPVAVVTSVENIPGLPFAKIFAKPSARLNSSQNLLLVFSEEASQIPPEDIWRDN